MTRLGNEKQPAIIRVQTLERAEEMAALCNKYGWKFIVGIEPDKPEDISDVEKLLASQPITMQKQKIGRNDPCPCSSGKKYKKCCLDKEINTPDMNAVVNWIASNSILGNEFAKVIKKYKAEPLDKISSNMFLDAFIFDHRLVNGKTPFEMFLENANIPLYQKSVFESYKHNTYSLFEVLNIDLGKGLELFDIISKNKYYIKERQGTYAVEKGSIVAGRIAKIDNGFIAISPAFSSFPKEVAFLLKKIFEPKSRFKLTAFDVLKLFLKNEEYPESVDELISELQDAIKKYRIDIDIASIDERINSNESPDEAFPEIHHAEVAEDKKLKLINLLYELWNKYPRKDFGGKSPEKISKTGPREQMLVQALILEVSRKINPDNYESIESAVEAANQMKEKWLNTPQKDLEGKTPLEVILEERKSMKNPDKNFKIDINLSKI